MATAKAKAKLKVVYSVFFCDDDLGEMDAFYEIADKKLTYITGWSCNDAHWRGEYMYGLLAHFGGKVESLPEEYYGEAKRLAMKEFGLNYSDAEEDDEIMPESISLEFQQGTSDKVYNLFLTKPAEGWEVEVRYGRRDGNLKTELKGEELSYEDAKKLYDKILNEKLKKGYRIA